MCGPSSGKFLTELHAGPDGQFIRYTIDDVHPTGDSVGRLITIGTAGLALPQPTFTQAAHGLHSLQTVQTVGKLRERRFRAAAD
jgi:hypothetical protein